jgi:NTP pyrophosphatase (non-canonical NTP hydrolase)
MIPLSILSTTQGLQKAVLTIEDKKGFLDESLSDKLIMLAEENGEVARAFLENDKQQLIEENIDCIFLHIAILNRLGADLQEEFYKKFCKWE